MAAPLALRLLCYVLSLVTLRVCERIVINKVACVCIARTDATFFGLTGELVAEQTIHAGTFVDVVVHASVTGFQVLLTVTLGADVSFSTFEAVAEVVKFAAGVEVEAAVAFVAGNGCCSRNAVVDQLISVGNNPLIGLGSRITHVGQTGLVRSNDVTAYAQVLKGIEWQHDSVAIVFNDCRLISSFVLEGIQLAIVQVAQRAGSRIVASCRIDNGNIAEQVVVAGAIPESVNRLQVLSDGQFWVARTGDAVSRNAAMMVAPVAVHLSNNFGKLIDVASLAGYMVDVTVSVGTVSTGSSVATVSFEAGVAGVTLDFATASYVVSRTEVGTAADGLVVCENVAFLTLHVRCGGVHVNVKVRIGVVVGTFGEGGAVKVSAGHGQIATLDSVTATSECVALQAVSCSRLGNVLSVRIESCSVGTCGWCHGGAYTGPNFCVLFVVAHQTVDVSEAGSLIVRTQTTTNVALSTDLPVAKDIDAVAVDGSGQFALQGASSIDHLGSFANPLIVSGVSHFIELGIMAAHAACWVGIPGVSGVITCWWRCTIRISSVNVAVAVIVNAIVTDFSSARVYCRENIVAVESRVGAVGTGRIAIAIAIIISTGWRRTACRVSGVGQAVAVVVNAIVADFSGTGVDAGNVVVAIDIGLVAVAVVIDRFSCKSRCAAE